MLVIGDWAPAATSDLSLHSVIHSVPDTLDSLHCPSTQGSPRTFALSVLYRKLPFTHYLFLFIQTLTLHVTS